jgi:hypothetical protein
MDKDPPAPVTLVYAAEPFGPGIQLRWGRRDCMYTKKGEAGRFFWGLTCASQKS